MWSVILLMSRLPGGRSRSAGRRPEKSATNSRQSVALTKRLVPTECSDRNGGSTTARRRCGRIAAGDTSTAQPRSALTGVVGRPSRPEGQPGRCCHAHSPNELPQG